MTNNLNAEDYGSLSINALRAYVNVGTCDTKMAGLSIFVLKKKSVKCIEYGK